MLILRFGAGKGLIEVKIVALFTITRSRQFALFIIHYDETKIC